MLTLYIPIKLQSMSKFVFRTVSQEHHAILHAIEFSLLKEKKTEKHEKCRRKTETVPTPTPLRAAYTDTRQRQQL